MTRISCRRRELLRIAGATGVLAATELKVASAADRPRSALRTPATSGILRPTRLAVGGPAPPFAVRVLSRMGFGPRPGDTAAFDALGSNDRQRLQTYVDQQLEPAAIADPELDTKLSGSDFFTLGKSLAALWRDHASIDDDWEYRTRPAFETERAAFLRAIYSRRQLAEVMADFWHTHFSVHAREFVPGPTFVHYDRDVIRLHSLGNFREMLEAVTRSAAMMYYLDNVSNRADGPNENFARELLELHTLGARNSFGFTPESEVPAYGDGLKQGYTEADIKAFTRALTGWTIQNGWPWPLHPNDNDNGEFWFRDAWHDDEPKRVLGVDITAGGIGEAQAVFDLLARHPEVARFVCEKLCRRLVSDQPPPALIEQAVAVFVAHRAAPDQMKQVVRTILLSEPFENTWGEKIKRPFESLVSGLRSVEADVSMRFDDRSETWGDNGFWFDTQNFLWQAQLSGHYPFGWEPPNGYPDYKEDWSGSTPLMMTWRLLTEAINHWGTAAGSHRIDVHTPTWNGLPNADDHTAEKLVDFWLRRVLGYLPTARRQPLIDFMAQDGDKDTLLDIDSEVWSETHHRAYTGSRLRTLVSLVLALPEFLAR